MPWHCPEENCAVYIKLDKGFQRAKVTRFEYKAHYNLYVLIGDMAPYKQRSPGYKKARAIFYTLPAR